MNIEAEIAKLEQQIDLVKNEGGRLNNAEWVLLMMLEHAVSIIKAIRTTEEVPS
jgi:hypothetical protein